jgi:UDP-glucose 4-epimerase
MSKCLVTGGAGFIGSHLTDKLISDGHDVVVVDNLSSGVREQVNSSAKFYQCDVRDEKIAEIFDTEKPEYIFHFAAQMSVPFSVDDPFNDLDVNGMGILNLLESAKKINIKKFIMSSTGGAIYGDATQIPTPETEIPKPLAPYGISKLLSENYLYFYKKTYGLDYCVLRYANVYGPRQLNAHESGVITIFIKAVLDSAPLRIYAYPDSPDGMIRDYVYVSDVVGANIAAMKAKSGIYNIGTSISTRTKELYNIISKITGIEVNISFYPPRDGDIKANTLDNSLAKDVLAWSPKVDLREGMRATINYFKSIRK